MIVSESDQFSEPLNTQINSVDCSLTDLPKYLSFVYDKYDLARFNLEIIEPINFELKTKAELAESNTKLLNQYVRTNAKEAQTIVIANLIPVEKSSKSFLSKMEKRKYKPKLIFEFDRGWKTPFDFQYLIPPKLYYGIDENLALEKMVADKGSVKMLLFINKGQLYYHDIIGQVNLDLHKVDLSFLNDVDWHWQNESLIKK